MGSMCSDLVFTFVNVLPLVTYITDYVHYIADIWHTCVPTYCQHIGRYRPLHLPNDILVGVIVGGL